MYRVTKIMNHNAILALKDKSASEYLILGKGIGFGKKVSEYVEPDEECRIYSLESQTKEASARKIFRDANPVYFEISNTILNEAEKEFGKVDRDILFPMADHIAFAVKRIRNGEQISNPLTQDIQVLFYKEYKIASMVRELLREAEGAEIDDDEIGYIALHVHSSIFDERVSSAMTIAAAVRECVSMIEKAVGKKIDVKTISYNRLMNHIKYMAARTLNKEELRLDMNDYIEHEFPDSFQIAKTICAHMSQQLHIQLQDTEIGYLAMHIERVYASSGS